MDNDAKRLSFFLTPTHECSYLPEREARTVFADPAAEPDARTQTALAAHGFRRSGRYIYRPSCPGCRACVPVRVPVTEFRPSRSQRRTRKRNADLQVTPRPAAFDAEHFALYNRYQQARHPEGQMLARSENQYLEFLTSPWADTRFYEMRTPAGELLAVAVVDRLAHALSAIYTFYDPGLPQRSLGSFAILWQIGEAARLGLSWVYLGYWIAESPKMRYKMQYRPLEAFQDGVWQRLEHQTQRRRLRYA